MRYLDQDGVAELFCPVIEFYHPISQRWPSAASTPASREYLKNSERAKWLVAPSYATLLAHSDVIDDSLEKLKNELRRTVIGPWACHVFLINQHKDPRCEVPEAELVMSDGIHDAIEIDDLPRIAKKCLDLLFTQVQFAGVLRGMFVSECFTSANFSVQDMVHYEISKHQDPRYLKPAYSAILAHHLRLAKTAVEPSAQIDHLLAGYQTSAAIDRPEGYSQETINSVGFFRSTVVERRQEAAALSERKKSLAAYHVHTTDEGMAELVSYLAMHHEVSGAKVRRIFTAIDGDVAQHLKDWEQRLLTDRSTPYVRGLALYKTIYEKHGYGFCVFAKTMCEANFRIMTNLLPVSVLVDATPETLVDHPTALLEKLASFEYTHTNACAKIAAAVQYLQLDNHMPHRTVIGILESLR